jgi:hypothetical protein
VEGSWVVSGAAEVAGAVASAEVGACEVAGAASEERNISISSWQYGGTVRASRSVCVWCLPLCLCICLCSSPNRSRASAPERVQGGSKEGPCLFSKSRPFIPIIPSSSYYACIPSMSQFSSLSRLRVTHKMTPARYRPFCPADSDRRHHGRSLPHRQV